MNIALLGEFVRLRIYVRNGRHIMFVLCLLHCATLYLPRQAIGGILQN